MTLVFEINVTRSRSWLAEFLSLLSPKETNEALQTGKRTRRKRRGSRWSKKMNRPQSEPIGTRRPGLNASDVRGDSLRRMERARWDPYYRLKILERLYSAVTLRYYRFNLLCSELFYSKSFRTAHICCT